MVVNLEPILGKLDTRPEYTLDCDASTFYFIFNKLLGYLHVSGALTALGVELVPEIWYLNNLSLTSNCSNSTAQCSK